jgi:hypothetical protein
MPHEVITAGGPNRLLVYELFEKTIENSACWTNITYVRRKKE